MSASILIVEDDPVLLRGLADRLRADGYRVRSACDGQSAIETAMDGPESPDLIILDVMLPVMDGWTVCRQLRREGFANPVLMLTARSQEEDVIHGLNCGADDYVSKPFALGELRARIQALLRRQRGHTRALRAGDCLLDLEARTLTRNGQPVPLTAQEYSVLAFLAANAGRALTRETILQASVKRSLFTGTRTIDRCIRILRSKIEPDPARPVIIQTVRDVGYRYVAS